MKTAGPAQRQTIFLGLGSNLDPEHHLRSALVLLQAHFGPIQRSPVCQTPAQGYAGADYWNLCVRLHTALGLARFNAYLKVLERLHGRRPDEPRLAPKSLDVDLLLVDDLITAAPPLPHPEILMYAHVLGPAALLDPNYRMPGTTQSLGALWAAFPERQHLRILDPDPL